MYERVLVDVIIYSPNFINGDVFCFNKNMQLQRDNAVTCKIVSIYSNVPY